LRGGLISIGGAAVSLSSNYQFYIQGDERYAGKSATVIRALPKDKHRNGIILALDKSSGLPLMVTITSPNNRALERFQFVDLLVGEEIDPSELEPLQEHHRVFDGTNSPCTSSPMETPNWKISWLPPGFVLSHVTVKENGDNILTFTDGLASFSVFISSEKRDMPNQAFARKGATLAFMTNVKYLGNKLSVVLVGEVPAQTANRVISSLTPMD